MVLTSLLADWTLLTWQISGVFIDWGSRSTNQPPIQVISVQPPCAATASSTPNLAATAASTPAASVDAAMASALQPSSTPPDGESTAPFLSRRSHLLHDLSLGEIRAALRSHLLHPILLPWQAHGGGVG